MMRRLIQVKNNKMHICSEAIGSQICFMPIVCVTVTDNEIDIELRSPDYYQIPEDLSAREKVSYLITCITRAETGQETDMHKFVNAFFDKTLEESTCAVIFFRNGSLTEADEPVNQTTNQF